MNEQLQKKLNNRKKNYAKGIYNDIVSAYESIEMPEEALEYEKEKAERMHLLVDKFYSLKGDIESQIVEKQKAINELDNAIIAKEIKIEGSNNAAQIGELNKEILNCQNQRNQLIADMVNLKNEKEALNEKQAYYQDLLIKNANEIIDSIVAENKKEKINEILSFYAENVDSDTFKLVQDMIIENNLEIARFMVDTEVTTKEADSEKIEEEVEEIKSEKAVEETEPKEKVEETKAEEEKEIESEEKVDETESEEKETDLQKVIELVEKAEKTKSDEDIDKAYKAVDELDDDLPIKRELIVRVIDASGFFSTDDDINEEKQNNEEEIYSSIDSFNELYDELKEKMDKNEPIESKKLNKLINIAVALKKEELESVKDKVNELIRYANAKDELARQNEELKNADTKVGFFNKAAAMITAFANRRKFKKQAKYVRKLEKAREAGNDKKADKILDKLVKSDENTNYRVEYLASKIRSAKANDEEVTEEVADAFENEAYYEYVDKDMDPNLVKEPRRLKGLVTSVANAIAFAPKSKKLNAIKTDLLNTIKKASISDLEKASYEYEFNRVNDFYDVNKNEYVEYNPQDFKYFDEDSEYAKDGIYTYNRRSK